MDTRRTHAPKLNLYISQQHPSLAMFLCAVDRYEINLMKSNQITPVYVWGLMHYLYRNLTAVFRIIVIVHK